MKKLLVFIFILSFHLKAQESDGFKTGAMALSRTQPYRGMSGQETVYVPYIGYKNGSLNIRGPFVSYDLTESRQTRMALTLVPNVFGGPFDPEDSDFFDGMKARPGSVDGGIRFSQRFGFLSFLATYRRDLLGAAAASAAAHAVGV